MRKATKIEMLAGVGVLIAAVLALVIWVAISRSTTQGFIQRGNAALQNKDWKTALEYFSRAEARIGYDADLRFGLLKAKVELSIEEKNQSNPAYRNRLEEAKPQLDELAAARANQAEVLLLQGTLYFHLDQYAKAVEILQAAQKLDPTSSTIGIALGRAQFSQRARTPRPRRRSARRASDLRPASRISLE